MPTQGDDMVDLCLHLAVFGLVVLVALRVNK